MLLEENQCLKEETKNKDPKQDVTLEEENTNLKSEINKLKGLLETFTTRSKNLDLILKI